MKKIITVFALTLGTLMAVSAQAQKTGYISLDAAVSLLPETAHLDSLLQKYQADSLGTQYQYLLGEYQRNDSIYRDSTKPKSVRTLAGQQMQGFLEQLQNWQQYAQQATMDKRDQLLMPLYQKVTEAVRAVAKEGNYAYIYRTEALLLGPAADDLLPAVAKKLNLKLPDGYKPGFVQ
jgi:outer membrane protein